MDFSSEFDPLARRILEEFDRLRREELDVAALAAALADVFAPPEELRNYLVRMTERGWLRMIPEDRFARSEAGRIAVARPLEVTLYTRPGCHLCEEAKAQILPLLHRYGAALREVNVETDSGLRERYTNDVPVIFLGPRKVAKHRVDPNQFRRQLVRAAAEAANACRG